ncbi:zinc finger protein 684-like [Anopheles merus]|uniref:zinc finger protein 684-like n=1 Tax=Anopheles merus TaxID=30066 RepID=UPI001BE424B7|nr:zinc finger protein 684-like [Anopheles merus]
MENAVPQQQQQMLQVCRFCLCENEESLVAIEDILMLTLAIQDVVRFTGIQIDEDNKSMYCMCLECIDRLKSCAAFRNTCLRNDALFQDLCSIVNKSGKEPQTEPMEIPSHPIDTNKIVEPVESVQTLETVETVELSDSSAFETTDCDDAWQAPLVEKSVCEPAPKRRYKKRNIDYSLYCPPQQPTVSWNAFAYRTTVEPGDDFAYSANYITPGEISYEEDDTSVDWENCRLNPDYPLIAYERQRGIRKLHMCDICGLLMPHLTPHMLTHEEAHLACPHCPVKMKQKTGLTQHIETVHLKTVKKTCHLCGKGFVHPKTYRYHMRAHQDAGESFQCPVCSKQFMRSISLEVHIKKTHSLVAASK